GIVDQDVQPAEACMDGRADRVDLLALPEVEGQQRRLPADGADRVVRFLQPALSAGDQHGMGAAPREVAGARGAESARRAGDERVAPFERTGAHRASVSRESCRSWWSSKSVSGIG